MAMNQTASSAGRNAYRTAWRNPSIEHVPRTNFDISESLLAQVDFKWLMAGHGWHVDLVRLEGDQSYAAKILDLAMNSESHALRECAASLLAQTGLVGERATGQ